MGRVGIQERTRATDGRAQALPPTVYPPWDWRVAPRRGTTDAVTARAA